MAGTLIVGAEEVVLRQDSHYASSSPIETGLELITALRSGMPLGAVFFICDVRDITEAEYWVRFNGMSGVNVVGARVEDNHLSVHERQWSQIQRLRAQGPIWMVITAYQEVLEHCRNTAQDVLLYSRRGSLGALPDLIPWDEAQQVSVQRRKAEALDAQ